MLRIDGTLIGAGNIFKEEDKSSECDGSRTIFYLERCIAEDSLSVHLNGLRQQRGIMYDYDLCCNCVIMTFPPRSDDSLVITYAV
jgi:hypothetical protein